MSVLVAVTDSKEGREALTAAAAEADLLNTDLVVVNLTQGDLDLSDLPDNLTHELVERQSGSDLDPVEAVLDAVQDRGDVTRLVVGLRKRSPLGKAVLGSVAQRLLLESPVPVLAVKAASV